MIYTLTPNPAIDYNISCDGLQPNTVTRTRDAVYTPNGKGLNVSFTLNHYGVDTAILGFFAGFSGRYIVEGARDLGVDVHPVWTEGITRVNVFLNAGLDTEYNMVNSGAAITAADERAMFELIDGLEDLDCLAISGSLPPNASEGFLRGAIERVRARGAQFVLDISSPQLADLLGLEPLLIGFAAAECLRGLPARRHRARPCPRGAVRARHLKPPARRPARTRAPAQ